MAQVDISIYFSELSACAKTSLAIEKQYLDIGLNRFFSKVNYSEGLTFSRSNCVNLLEIVSKLEKSRSVTNPPLGLMNYAKSLLAYSESLSLVLEGLAAKAAGKSHSGYDYELNLARLDRCREYCGVAQSSAFT